MDSYCVKCSLQFDKRSIFDKHMSIVHQKMSKKEDLINIEEPEEDTFPCEICDKSFSAKQTLKIHTSTVHENKTLFECEICYKTFIQKGSLHSCRKGTYNSKKICKIFWSQIVH